MESRIHREVYGRFGGEHTDTRLRWRLLRHIMWERCLRAVATEGDKSGSLYQ